MGSPAQKRDLEISKMKDEMRRYRETALLKKQAKALKAEAANRPLPKWERAPPRVRQEVVPQELVE